MNRKIRKWLSISLAVACLCCFSACKKHEHSYADGWYYDENTHWRIATCDDMKGQKYKESNHNFVDGFCTLCGCPDPDFVSPSEDPKEDEPGTEEPKEDPELPDDEEGNTERPTPPSSEDDETKNDPFLDADDDTLFSPKKEYTWGISFYEDEFKFTEMKKDDKTVGYAISARSSLTPYEVTIPAEYNNLPVLMIDDNGFNKRNNLRKIILPEGMLYIGEKAFYQCSDLYHVTIPSSMKLIGARAFYGCAYLTQVTLPEGVEDIRYGAFKGCAFDKFVIPNSVTNISSLAFYNCMCLKELTFGSGVKSVGAQAFCNSDKLERVNISDLNAWCNVSFALDNSNPLYYGADLYLKNSILKKAEIPEDCQVNRYSFFGCTSIEELTVKSRAEKIGKNAFTNCSALRKVTFREGVKEIGDSAFSSCEKLDEVVFPDSVQIIKRDAFRSCKSLKKIVFGKGIATLEQESFTNLPKSAEFFYRGTEEEWRKVSKQSNWATGANSANVHFNYKDES